MLGLYRGFWPTLLRDVPEIAIQFTLYERCEHASAASLCCLLHMTTLGKAPSIVSCRPPCTMTSVAALAAKQMTGSSA